MVRRVLAVGAVAVCIAVVGIKGAVADMNMSVSPAMVVACDPQEASPLFDLDMEWNEVKVLNYTATDGDTMTPVPPYPPPMSPKPPSLLTDKTRLDSGPSFFGGDEYSAMVYPSPQGEWEESSVLTITIHCNNEHAWEADGGFLACFEDQALGPVEIPVEKRHGSCDDAVLEVYKTFTIGPHPD